jgi:protease I
MSSSQSLGGLTACILADEGVEDLEYYVTLMRLQEEGVSVVTASMKGEDFQGKNGLWVTPDSDIFGVTGKLFDVVVLPGGWAPDKLRRSTPVLDLIRSNYQAGNILAAICHGPWLLASADLVRGMKATGSLGIRDDMQNAGATWVDEAAFTEGQFVWGRVVADIPAFCSELVSCLRDFKAAKS